MCGHEIDGAGTGVCPDGKTHTDYRDPHKRWSATCPICGSSTRGEDVAEVIYKTTGARGIAHAECYLADRCCYTLA
jgi:hypothetical protein